MSKRIIVKLGGHANTDTALLHQFAGDVMELVDNGYQVVVTHGGGPQIDTMLQRLGMEPKFIKGLRYTDGPTMDVVRMTLTGQVQRQIVNACNAIRPIAVGVSGEDGGLLMAAQRTTTPDGTAVDLGYVGEVTHCNTAVLDALFDAGLVPVVTGVGAGMNGEVFNLNADSATCALAVALKADGVVLLTDVDSLYADWPIKAQPIHDITAAELDTMLPTLDGGMAPKMEACLHAVRRGVGYAQIVDGTKAHALSNAINGTKQGTTVTEHG